MDRVQVPTWVDVALANEWYQVTPAWRVMVDRTDYTYHHHDIWRFELRYSCCAYRLYNFWGEVLEVAVPQLLLFSLIRTVTAERAHVSIPAS